MLYWILRLCSSTWLSRDDPKHKLRFHLRVCCIAPIVGARTGFSFVAKSGQYFLNTKVTALQLKGEIFTLHLLTLKFGWLQWICIVNCSVTICRVLVLLETTIGVWKQFYRRKKPFKILLWSSCRWSTEHMVVCRRRKKYIKASPYLLHESSKTDVNTLSFKLYLSYVGINSDGSILPEQQWRSGMYAVSINSHAMCLCSPCGAQKTREQLKSPPQDHYLGTWTTTLTPESRMIMLCHFFVQRWAWESE